MENPEAFLDILSLRSFNKRYHEASDNGITDIPIGIQSLTKSEDLETFARDLTIDNSISACFEDSSLSSSDIGVNCRQSTQNIHQLSDEIHTKQQYKDGIEITSAKDFHQSEEISQKTKQIGLELATVNGRKYCLSEKKSHEKCTNEKNVTFGLHCGHAQGETQTKQIEPATHDEIVIINNCHNSNEVIKKLKAFPKLHGNLQLPEKESNAHVPNIAVGNRAPKPCSKEPCKPDNKISQFESSISPFVETFLLEMINRELIHQVFGKQFLIERFNSMLSEATTNLSMSQILDSLNSACEHIKLLENDKTQTRPRDSTDVLKNLERTTLNLTEFKFSIQVIQDKMALELMETCFDDSIEILTLSRALFHDALSIAKVHPQDLNKKIKDLVVNHLKKVLAEVSCFSSPAINCVTKKREFMEVPSHTSLIQKVKQSINSANSDNSSNYQSNGHGLKTIDTFEDTPSLKLLLLGHTDRDHLNILNPDEKYPQEKKGFSVKKKNSKNTMLPNEMPGLEKKSKDFENELDNFENNPCQRPLQIKQNIQHHNYNNTSINQCDYINNNDHDNLLLTSLAKNYQSCRESNGQRYVCNKNCKAEKKRQKYVESCRRGRRKHRKFWNESWYKRQKHNYTSKLSSTISSTQSTSLSEKPNFYLQKISYKSKNASFSKSLSKKQKKSYCDNYESDDEDEYFVGVRVNVENEDLTDEGLRIHRLQRHLQSVQKLRQNNEEIIETIITGTGEKLVPHDQCKESKDCPLISDSCQTSRSTNALAETVFEPEGHSSQKPLSRIEVPQRHALINLQRGRKAKHFLNTAICEETLKVKCNVEKCNGQKRVFNMKQNEQVGFGIPWDQLNFTESDETDVSEKI